MIQNLWGEPFTTKAQHFYIGKYGSNDLPRQRGLRSPSASSYDNKVLSSKWFQLHDIAFQTLINTYSDNNVTLEILSRLYSII